MNPCPVHDARTGTVFLFFVAIRGQTPELAQITTGRNAARLCCVTSRDAGRTWGSARDLTAEAVGATERGRWAQGAPVDTWGRSARGGVDPHRWCGRVWQVVPWLPAPVPAPAA